MAKKKFYDKEEYERLVLEEVRADAAYNGMPTLRGLSLVEFPSKSNGKGRNHRRPREVALVKYGAIALQVVGGEIRCRRDGLSADIIAQEALAFLPLEERTSDNLLFYARKKIK